MPPPVQTQRKRPCDPGAETGGMRPQAKESLGALEAGRSQEGPSPQAPETLVSDLWPPDLWENEFLSF